MADFLGGQIKKYRTKKHFSQEQVATCLGISRSVFTQMENGKRKITADELKNLSALLGVSADVLLFGKADTSPERSLQMMPDISYALSNSFIYVFYVDLRDNSYISPHLSGTDFFSDFSDKLKNDIHQDDLAELSAFLQKENLIAALKRSRSVSAYYRLVSDAGTVYYRIHVSAPREISTHIIVTVEDVTETVTKDQLQKIQLKKNQNIIEILASEYSSIYYVDLKTDTFEVYKLDAETQTDFGDVFFGDLHFSEAYRICVKNMVHRFDREKMLKAGSVYNILQTLKDKNSFTVSYRSNDEKDPHYCEMKVVKMESCDFPSSVVIGFADKNPEKNLEIESAQRINNVIQLANNFEAVYDIDLETGEYRCYDGNDTFAGLTPSGTLSGNNIFIDIPAHLPSHVYEEDIPLIKALFTKEYLTRTLAENPDCQLDFRLLLNDTPVWYHLKIVLNKHDNRDSLVLGIFNIEDQRRREQYHLNQIRELTQKANHDTLTGMRNRNAYMFWENELNQELQNDKGLSFAVLVFDVNDLKKTNDLYGHEKGDRLLMASAHIISGICRHSPVFRIGGDEFAVILRGTDYEKKEDILSSFRKIAMENLTADAPVIASGMAVRTAKDRAVIDVFKRADEDMYKNKLELKNL